MNLSKIFSVALLAAPATFLYSQNIQVQNAYMYLGEKQYDKAKAAADAAVTNDKTRDVPKAWLYRGQIYQAIMQDTSKKINQLDPEAAEKAVQSFVKCIELDKEKIYKETKGGLTMSAGALLSKVQNYYIPDKQYDKAVAACDILKTAVPHDEDESLKRRNVTNENILYTQYRAYYLANNTAKAKELGDQLIGMHYKMPSVYSTMSKLSLTQKDTAGALAYLDKGLALFDDNMDLLTSQIDILMMQKKNDVLRKKLESAVELNPNNDILHSALANVYEKTHEPDKAEQEYLKALEVNPKSEYALFNLGALYFNRGNEWNKKLNDLPASDKTKSKEYEAKTDESFKKAIPYFEQYYQIKPDAAVKQRLRLLYNRLGDTEKAEKYK